MSDPIDGETSRIEAKVAEALRKRLSETAADDAAPPSTSALLDAVGTILRWTKANSAVLVVVVGVFGTGQCQEKLREYGLREDMSESNQATMDATATSQKTIAEGVVIRALDPEQLGVYPPADAFSERLRHAVRVEVKRQLAEE